MRRPGHPLFLARAPYRQRRLQDAARLLPILGLILLVLPLLGFDRTPSITSEAVYFFVVWGGLILVAAAFATGLRSTDPAKGAEKDPIPDADLGGDD